MIHIVQVDFICCQRCSGAFRGWAIREGACTHLAKQLGVEICSVDARNILENGYLGDEKGEKKGRDVDRADW